MRQPHFNILGFPVRVEMTALFIVGFLVYQGGGAGVALVALLFFSVLLHELGHALMFRRYGCSAFISLHGLGGSTMSTGGRGLSDKQQVLVSLAGPLAQLVLLGIPATIIYAIEIDNLFVGGFEVAFLLMAVAWINVAMPLFNLLPIYPLDGGQILYHLLRMTKVKDPWKITRAITVTLGGLAALMLYTLNFRIGALLVGYMVFQAFQRPGPGTSGGGFGQQAPPNRIQQAAADARRNAPQQQSSTDAFAEAYERMLDGNTYRLSALRDVLASSHPTDMATLDQWQRALDGDFDGFDQSPSPLLKATVFVAMGGDPHSSHLQQFIQHYLDSPEITAAMVLLNRHDKLPAALTDVPGPLLETIRERMLSAGLPGEQMAVARIIRLRSEGQQPAPPTEPPSFP